MKYSAIAIANAFIEQANNGKINNEYLKRDIYEKFHKK